LINKKHSGQNSLKQKVHYPVKYPLLEEFATNWDSLKSSVTQARSHHALDNHFKNIFETTTDYSKSIKIQLDEILSLLVTNFDDEELPLLQNEVRLNQLIIQKDGDKKAAQALIDNEKHIFNEKVDFLQMLTNAALIRNYLAPQKLHRLLPLRLASLGF
jgi:hypothetical protein